MLDEADEMLSMGFQENVEEILSYIPVGKEYQMLLWSATVPAWVKKLSHKSVLLRCAALRGSRRCFCLRLCSEQSASPGLVPPLFASVFFKFDVVVVD